LDETTLPFYAELVAARDKMRADPHYSLLPKYRLPIYKAVQEKAPDVEYKFYGWLALITAEKVLPIWEELVPDDEEPILMLKIAKQLLLGQAKLEDFAEEFDDFYYAVGAFLCDEQIPFPVRAALNACYTALEANLPIRPFQQFSAYQIEQGFADERIHGSWLDAASDAVLAYSGQAYDLTTISDYNLLLKSSELGTILASITPPEFKPEKRREFWEWWLNEALPEAWLEANATRDSTT
jgi:hypothetical protein